LHQRPAAPDTAAAAAITEKADPEKSDMTKKQLSPELIAQVRQRYADGVRIEEILAEFDVSKGTLYYWVDGGPKHGPDRRPPLPRRDCPRGARKPWLRGSRGLMIKQLWRTAARKVQEIELRLDAAGQEPSERERDARMLAVLVKTLRELAAFDQAHLEKTAKKGAPRDDDDAVPDDVDELRRELARRVDRIRQRRNSAGGAGGDAA
jgi:hypothetical protein